MVSVEPLESIFERGSRVRVLVRWEHYHDDDKEPSRMRLYELRKTPNKKKIKAMVETYARRGLVAKDGGDYLILPESAKP